MNQLVTIEYVHEHHQDDNIILLDCSFNIEQFTHLSIPGAQYFDIKLVFSDHTSQFPNTLPSKEQFEKEAGKLGINNASKIIVFDNKGIYSSPRVWWMFKTMGHEDVFVLDGGLPAWIEKGYSLESFKESPFQGNFSAKIVSNNIKYYGDIVQNIFANSFLVVDARSEGRFNGTAPEPRETLQSGHIKYSKNIPFTSVLSDGKFKSKKELQEIFKDIDSDKELVFSCGSGITACILSLASELYGRPSRTIFDGSWTEWAERNRLMTDM